MNIYDYTTYIRSNSSPSSITPSCEVSSFSPYSKSSDFISLTGEMVCDGLSGSDLGTAGA